jgi:hypothetical protein
MTAGLAEGWGDGIAAGVGDAVVIDVGDGDETPGATELVGVADGVTTAGFGG